MKQFINKNWLTLLGVVIGAAGGYMYWFYIGCTSASGTCVITSSPVNSTLWGAAVGGLLFSMFKISKNKSDE